MLQFTMLQDQHPLDVSQIVSFQALLQLVLAKQSLGKIPTQQPTRQHLVEEMMDQAAYLTAA